ncbi:MAG: hypothetical protein ACI88C_002322 [Acidimicrobiales bacterium]|jgi:hypothetical protein
MREAGITGGDLKIDQQREQNRRLSGDGELDPGAGLEDRKRDLDYLVAAIGEAQVDVLETVDSGRLTVSEPADAHDNHNVRSTWWRAELDGSDVSSDTTGFEPIGLRRSGNQRGRNRLCRPRRSVDRRRRAFRSDHVLSDSIRLWLEAKSGQARPRQPGEIHDLAERRVSVQRRACTANAIRFCHDC